MPTSRLTYEQAELRLRNLMENASIIGPYLLPPDDLAPHNYRVFRSLYISGDTVISAGIASMTGRDTVIAIYRRWSNDSQPAIQKISCGIDSTPEEAAVFLGLDNCYPRIPTWTETTGQESPLIQIRGEVDALGRIATNHSR